ncbi:MAG: hypothetical protein M3332_13660 [Actinomycetota bacterium]|nr:hypothetical protein [Actinomycetota bacterium]
MPSLRQALPAPRRIKSEREGGRLRGGAGRMELDVNGPGEHVTTRRDAEGKDRASCCPHSLSALDVRSHSLGAAAATV